MIASRSLLAVVIVFTSFVGLISAVSVSARPASPTAEWRLEGRIYEGIVGDESKPVPGVTVELFGSNDPFRAPATFLRNTATDGTGWYGLTVYSTDAYQFFYLHEVDPGGYISVGASSVDGTIQEDNWIQYAVPLAGKVLTGNKFWDQVGLAKIDGVVSDGEWNAALNIPLEHGRMHYQNDSGNLYLLVDLTGDTHDDPPIVGAPWGDFFWLSFDVDVDGAITPDLDLNYGLYPGSYDMGVAKYKGPGTWTGLFPCNSKLGAGFGASFNSVTPHRIWEFAIRLPDIGAGPDDLVRLGLRTYSQTPGFSDENPENFFTDFTNLIEITLMNHRAFVPLVLKNHP